MFGTQSIDFASFSNNGALQRVMALLCGKGRFSRSIGSRK